jgi:hypothetical protein
MTPVCVDVIAYERYDYNLAGKQNTAKPYHPTV